MDNNKKIEPSEIRNVLTSLGYKLKDDGGAWRANALYRGGKNSNSLMIYKNSGVWSDYGTGVYSQPFSKLLELSGGDGNTKINSTFVQANEEDDSEEVNKIYPNEILSKLIPHYKFYEDSPRNIKPECLKRLKAGLATGGKMYQRIVFPILNRREQIIGFSGRYIGSTKDKPKWKHIGKKRLWSYPMYFRDSKGEFFVINEIKRLKEVILVESIGDLLAFHNQGIYNVIVAFGLTLSPKTICFLIEMNVEKIFISFNNDSNKKTNSGKNASIQLFLELLSYFDYNSLAICLPTKGDFGEMNTLDFSGWVNKKNTINYNHQREFICKIAESLVENKEITKKCLKNLRYLNCE